MTNAGTDEGYMAATTMLLMNMILRTVNLNDHYNSDSHCSPCQSRVWKIRQDKLSRRPAKKPCPLKGCLPSYVKSRHAGVGRCLTYPSREVTKPST